MILQLLLWLFITIIIGVFACFAAKRLGVEYLVAMFAVSIVIANTLAVKLIQVGPLATSTTVVVYSITFLLTDTISEFWGKQKAKKAVWSGFLGLMLLVFIAQISIQLVPAPFWGDQEAFVKIFSNSWRISLGSFVAYTVSQSHDVWAYHYWKKKTEGKYLWLRNNLSTWVSQTLDTIIIVVIAFAGIAPLWPLIWGSILIKIIIAAIDTPFLYLVRWYYNKISPRWRKRVLDD